ncbi:MAG: hypothetical protein ACQET8_16585 [Bacillota bacterium]
MKKSKLICVIILFVLSIFINKPVHTSGEMQITNPDVVRKFMIAIMTNDFSKEKSFLKHSIKVPEIRENTPISGYQSLPSPKKNKKVIIAHFNKEPIANDGPIERIAFIWELSIIKDKIAAIDVVYDGSNPFMNEPIKAFHKQFNKKLLVPSYFPFNVTHVEDYVTKSNFGWAYKNNKTQDILKINAHPYTRPNRLLSNLKNKEFKPFILSNGKESFSRKLPNGFQITFIHDSIIYTVDLKGENPTKIKLLQAVDSMFPK